METNTNTTQINNITKTQNQQISKLNHRDIKQNTRNAKQGAKQKNASSENTNNKDTNNKITNWHQYSLALAKRGDFNLLIDIAEKKGAFSKPLPSHTRGKPLIYNDELIVLILIFHELYRLPLRQATMFTWNIMVSRGKYVKIPDYTTISRRAAKLNINILPDDYYLYAGSSIDLLVDSSGFYVHGEGNWFRRKHGMQKHRMWQETHIGVDYNSRMILSVINTPSNVHDNTQLLPLITGAEITLRRANIVQNLNSVIGDGAYEANNNYRLAKQLDTTFIAPPHKNAVYHYDLKDGQIVDIPGWEDRNKVIREIQRCGELEEWKKQTSYHKRSLVENAFYRLKIIFGDKMLMRTTKNRYIEQLIRVKILNLFTTYGLPQYN